MTSGARHHQAMRAAGVPLAILCGLNLLLRLGVALRPLPCLDGLAIPDDAYLSLTLARNMARGLGPFYSVGYTNGFQPLYVFLAVPFYWLWPADPVRPVHGALLLLAIADTLALILLCRLILRRGRSGVAPLLVAAAWIFNPYIMQTTANGLETILALGCIVAVFAAYDRLHRSAAGAIPARGDFILGALVGLAILARIDGVFLLPSLALGIALREWPRPGRIRLILKRSLLLALGALLVVAPWLAYSYHYTGDLYPVSGRATRYAALFEVNHQPGWGNFYGPVFYKSLEVLWRSNRVLIVTLAALGGLFLFQRRHAPRRWHWKSPGVLRAPLAAFSLLLYLAYTFHISARWYFPRYFFPLVMPLLLAAAALAEACSRAIRLHHRRLLFQTALLLAVALGQGLQPGVRRILAAPPDPDLGYMNVGLWAGRTFAPGTIIGGAQTGALAYFADRLTVVNLDGVVNKACYQALREKRAMDYLRQAGVRYFVGWDLNKQLIQTETRGYRKDDLQALYKIEGFRSWTLDWYLYRVRGVS